MRFLMSCYTPVVLKLNVLSAVPSYIKTHLIITQSFFKMQLLEEIRRRWTIRIYLVMQKNMLNLSSLGHCLKMLVVCLSVC